MCVYKLFSHILFFEKPSTILWIGWAFALTFPDPGDGEVNTTEFHQSKDEVCVRPDLPNPGYHALDNRAPHQPIDDLYIWPDLT